MPAAVFAVTVTSASFIFLGCSYFAVESNTNRGFGE